MKSPGYGIVLGGRTHPEKKGPPKWLHSYYRAEMADVIRQNQTAGFRPNHSLGPSVWSRLVIEGAPSEESILNRATRLTAEES